MLQARTFRSNHISVSSHIVLVLANQRHSDQRLESAWTGYTARGRDFVVVEEIGIGLDVGMFVVLVSVEWIVTVPCAEVGCVGIRVDK